MTNTDHMSEDDLTALRNRLMAKAFMTDGVEQIEEAILRRHRQLLYVNDPTQPWKGENRAWVRALVVGAKFRTGKTRAIREALKRLKDISLPDGKVLPAFAISVTAPEHFTMEALGRAILNEMKLMPARSIGTTATIERLHTRIALKRPTIIHIDEAQRMLKPDRVAQHRRLEEQVKIFGQLRALIDLKAWPVILVLSGTPELIRALEHEEFGFFRELADFVAIAPLSIGNPDHQGDLEDALVAAVEKADMTVDLEGCNDFYDRLMLAANFAWGFAFDICHEAILLAAEDGRKSITVEDFAAFYARKAGCFRAANPFVAEEWQVIDPRVLLAKMTGDMASRVWDAER